MKIYFCGSIRGGRQLAVTYEKLIHLLKAHGQVLSEHLGNDEVIQSKDRMLGNKEIHDRDLQWLCEADVVVAEVTVPSLGVGYEIGRAIEMGKPILCLFKSGSETALSAMIAGSEGVVNYSYDSVNELRPILARFLTEHASDRSSSR